jgi:superfamily II DNA helicase RecQ
MIRFVVIDEIHLVSHFGSSFRKEFSALKDVLFKKISNHIPVLMLTATCNNWVYQSIQQILGVTINQVHWPSGEQMRHRSVAINVSYGTKSTSFITKSLKKNLMEREDYKILVYSNSRNHIVDISEKLKSNFLDCDECLNNIRLVTLIGTMTKEEKAAYIRLFVHNGEHPISPRIRILCATSGVGNAGIDCRHIKTVYHVGFPPSILDLAQEKGHAG